MAGLLAGVHELQTPATTRDRYGLAENWGREFVAAAGGGALPSNTALKTLLDKVEKAVRPHEEAGGGCVLSLKIDPRQMAAGLWDERLTAVGAALAGRNVVLILWHEPEDNWAGGIFAAGFNRGRVAVKAGGPFVLVAYCAMAYQWSPGRKSTRDPAIWALIDADLYLVDVYSGKTYPGDLILPDHPGFVRWYEHMIAPYPQRSWGVAERGFAAGADRPAAWAREFDWLATSDVGRSCTMYLAWLTSGTEKNAAWLADAPTEAAIAGGLTLITTPPGFVPAAVAGAVLHSATGALVADGMQRAWVSFVERAHPV